VGREQLWEDQALVFPRCAGTLFTLTSAHRNCPCSSREGLKGRISDKQVTGRPFILFKHKESTASHFVRWWVTKKLDR